MSASADKACPANLFRLVKTARERGYIVHLARRRPKGRAFPILVCSIAGGVEKPIGEQYGRLLDLASKPLDDLSPSG